MHIVILNWRDIKNPQSGGAEVLTHEISKYLVEKGHTVTQFSSLFSGSKQKEVVDGVHIVRDGHPDLRSGFRSVHYKAYKYYRSKKFGKVDIFIDEVHGVPFFTPLYVKEKKIALICERAGELWSLVMPHHLSFIGDIFEHIYPLLYKKVAVVTISQSSKDDLAHIFAKKDINIMSPGCNTPIVTLLPKKPNMLTFVFIARLSKSKGIEDAIAAVNLLKEKKIRSKLYVIGRGTKEYTNYLARLVEKNGLENYVVFSGFVTETDKIKVIDKSHFLVAPSLKEGWGLTVHEAGARGVPTIAYNVLGLRDIVKDGKNGFLTSSNNPEGIVDAILKAFNDKQLYKKIQMGAVAERKKFSWANCCKQFLRIINNENSR